MTGSERVDETELPAREHFFNKLSETSVSDEDYAHTQNVWSKFKLSHRVYLTSPYTHFDFTELDISKLVVYDFHYNYAVAKYGDRFNCWWQTQTASSTVFRPTTCTQTLKLIFIFLIHRIILQIILATATTTKKVVGKFKDETCRKPITEFVCFRAKGYSLLLSDNENKRVAKGAQRFSIKNGYATYCIASGYSIRRLFSPLLHLYPVYVRNCVHKNWQSFHCHLMMIRGMS